MRERRIVFDGGGAANAMTDAERNAARAKLSNDEQRALGLMIRDTELSWMRRLRRPDTSLYYGVAPVDMYEEQARQPTRPRSVASEWLARAAATAAAEVVLVAREFARTRA
jgi:predicted metal-dependent peptidase